MTDRQRIAARRRRGYMVTMVGGIFLVMIGAVLAERGTGEGPREVWFSTASWADWLGGLTFVIGGVLLTIGWLGRRNG